MTGLMKHPLAVQDLMLSAPFFMDNRDGNGAWRTVSSVENLLQAIWVRLNTAEGSLKELGHPEYGSRLHLLVGQLDVPETHERARLYIARALSRELRIAEILSIEVVSNTAGYGRTLTVSVNVRPVSHNDIVQFGFSILLEPTP